MGTHVQKWGNSLAVRLPTNILKKLKLEQGSEVEITIHEDHIAISPKIDKLDNLLDQISDNNTHDLYLDSDEDSKGSEAW